MARRGRTPGRAGQGSHGAFPPEWEAERLSLMPPPADLSCTVTGLSAGCLLPGQRRSHHPVPHPEPCPGVPRFPWREVCISLGEEATPSRGCGTSEGAGRGCAGHAGGRGGHLLVCVQLSPR